MSALHPHASTRQLYEVFTLKLRRWDLTKRDRIICDGLLELTFAQGLMSVTIECLQDLAEFLELDKSEVSIGLRALEREGVVQVRGPKRGPREYRLLPNAELVEPAPRVAPAAKLAAFARIMAANAHGPGVDPGGQLRLAAVQTNDEILADELAAGSQARALEPDETGYIPESPEWYREKMRRSIVGESSTSPPSLGNPQRSVIEESPTIPVAALRVHVRPPETLNVKQPTANVERFNVGEAPEERQPAAPPPPGQGSHRSISSTQSIPSKAPAWSEEAEYAFREVAAVCAQSTVGAGDFKAYERKWRQRCALEPQRVAEAAAEIRHRMKGGETIRTPGGYILWLVNDWLKPLGRSLKLL